jgi:hypothetical protein
LINSKLHIITLNWNGEDKLKHLAPSLVNSLNDIDYNWLIKDNASTDNSIDYLKSLNNKNIEIISYKDNLQNFSQGCNYIFNIANPKPNDLILLLNNDIIFNDKNSIKKMISLLKEDVGIVGAKLLFNNTKKIQHAGVVFHNKHKLPHHFRINEMDDLNSSKNRYFQAVTGACLLTKAEYYALSDKMDEKYHWAFEDIDLCLKINKFLNKKIIYCGDTNIFHEESATLKKNPVKNLFMQHNINYFFNKWTARYIVDHDTYLNNKNYNLI